MVLLLAQGDHLGSSVRARPAWAPARRPPRPKPPGTHARRPPTPAGQPGPPHRPRQAPARPRPVRRPYAAEERQVRVSAQEDRLVHPLWEQVFLTLWYHAHHAREIAARPDAGRAAEDLGTAACGSDEA